MTFPAQTRLGSYEIAAALGAGGMGEVYRARDTKLGREVAIKVLPKVFAQDKDRLARFEREARILASLNHPNIAAIYELERSRDLCFLVMELVEGPTLRERLGDGALDLQVTLTIFSQIARALEAAHEKGIVHRDLKPENVKITPEGTAKVLDFGLAKAFAKDLPADKLSVTPTATYKGTSSGVILGTVPYMSPEQARGQPVDKRTDVWSFGCCFYEALAGRHPFWGATASDVLVAVLGSEPDWKALPRNMPRNLFVLLRRCLQKDARQRLHDIGDARIEIEDALSLELGTGLGPSDIGRRGGRALPWALGALVGMLAGATITYLIQPKRDSPVVRRFVLELPPTAPLALNSGPALAVSPDGTRAVYTATRGDTTQLYVRAIDQLEPTPIPGTEGGTGPVLSPDGYWLAFFAQGKLKKLPLSGGTALNLAEGPAQRGATWGPADKIVFSPLTTSGLTSVSASGTAPQVITNPDVDQGEKSHRWPDFLPGKRGVIFTAWTGGRFDVQALSLDSGEKKTLIQDGTYTRYAPTGHLVFVRGSDLHAVPFDPGKLEVVGQPVSLIEDLAVERLSGAAFFSFSGNGMLVYAPAGPVELVSHGVTRLLLVDRQGVAASIPTPERAFQLPRLSPDGRQLLVTATEGEKTDVWVHDLQRGAMTRLTFEANSAAAIWTPDGERAVFSSDTSGVFNLYWRRSDGTGGVERLTTSENTQIPTSWSPDGKKLVFTELGEATGFDVWLFSMEPRGRTESLLRTSFNENGAAFSPDGRWIAYVSDETGQDEVYVTAYPQGGKWQISTDGGSEPVWAPQGQEIFYRNREWMMAVSIETEPRFTAGRPRLLFEAPYAEPGAAYPNFDVTRDGQRFVMIQSKLESAATRLIVVLNWFEELRARAPHP